MVRPSSQGMTASNKMTQFCCSLFTSVLTGLLVVSGLASCAVNPATGGANLVLMSESREKEVGAEEHAKVLASQPVYQDEALLAYVTEVGNRVAAASHRPDLEYTYTIIDSPAINAMALPGGYVYINRGLLTFINTEAQLAAVIAHEIGHITARHAVQQQARGRLANAVAQVGGFVTRGNREWLRWVSNQPGGFHLGANRPEWFWPGYGAPSGQFGRRVSAQGRVRPCRDD